MLFNKLQGLPTKVNAYVLIYTHYIDFPQFLFFYFVRIHDI